MEQLGSHWTDFDETWYLSFFRKYVEKIQVPLKSDINDGYFTLSRFYIYDNIPLIFLIMRDVLDFVEKIKAHTLCSVTFFRKSCRLWDNVEMSWSQRGHKWSHNMAHTRWMLDKPGYMHAQASTSPRSRTHARTHTQILTLIAFPRQECLLESTSMLSCLSC